MFLFYTAAQTLENLWKTLVISGAIKWQHWSEMDSYIIDLFLAKKIRLKGFSLATLLYELNTGVCCSIFCIQFRCEGTLINNPEDR